MVHLKPSGNLSDEQGVDEAVSQADLSVPADLSVAMPIDMG